jgi:hypothetical protein
VLAYSPSDVIESIRKAKNLNSAVKNFLKREVAGDAKAAQFAKDLRAAFEAKLPERGQAFIEKNLTAHEVHLLSIIRYAYAEGLAQIVEAVATQHADNFAKTYTPGTETISVTDKKNFEGILTQVVKSLSNELSTRQIPANNFMKNAVLVFLLEPQVFREAQKLFAKLS